MRRKIATIYDNLLSTIGASCVCVCVCCLVDQLSDFENRIKKMTVLWNSEVGGGERRAEREKYAE